MPSDEQGYSGVPPKKPSENELKKDLDFIGKLYKVINKVHIVDVTDSKKPDFEYANAFKVSCERENISTVVTLFNEHSINVVYCDNAKYLVDCKFKIIASSETELIENYEDIRKRKNKTVDAYEYDENEDYASENDTNISSSKDKKRKRIADPEARSFMIAVVVIVILLAILFRFIS